MPKLTTYYLKLLYQLARKVKTKKKSITVANEGFMSEENWMKYQSIINECKQGK